MAQSWKEDQVNEGAKREGEVDRDDYVRQMAESQPFEWSEN